MNETLLAIICGFLMVLGTLGAILPFLPGLPLALLGLGIFAWFTDEISIWGLAVFAILTLITIVVDILAPAIAAKGRKASRLGVMGAIIGGILGIFALGPIGILLGPFVGAFIGEIMNAANTEHALRVAVASMFGLVISSIFKLMVGTGMFIYFLIAIIN
jgi:uncharacterized protein YqgC (DUF456 family)